MRPATAAVICVRSQLELRAAVASRLSAFKRFYYAVEEFWEPSDPRLPSRVAVTRIFVLHVYPVIVPCEHVQ